MASLRGSRGVPDILSSLSEHRQLVTAFSLLGVLAFGISGFLGYQTDPQLIRTIFHPAVAVFLWLSSAIVAFEYFSLRQGPAGRLRFALAATLLAIALVAAVYVDSGQVASLLQWVGNQIKQRIPDTGGGRLIYSLLDLGLLGVFLASFGLRTLRVARGLPVDGSSATRAKDRQPPSLSEQISGDLLGGAALAGLLAFLLRAPVLQFLVDHVITFFIRPSQLEASTAIQTTYKTAPLFTPDHCTVTLVFAPCRDHAPDVVAGPWSLELIDRYIGLVFLIFGLGFLAPLLLLAALAARQLVTAGAEPAIELLRAVRNTFYRRIRIAFADLTALIRPVLLPVLILLSITGAAISAHYIQSYLHLVSDLAVCSSNYSQSSCLSFREDFPALAGTTPDAAVVSQAQGSKLISLGVAVAAGIATWVTAILAVVTLLAGSSLPADDPDDSSAPVPASQHGWRVRFLKFQQAIFPPGTVTALTRLAEIGYAVLVSLWAFWLLLWAINALLALIQVSPVSMRRPFSEIGVTSLLSLTAVVVSSAVVFYRYRYRRQQSARHPKPGGALS